MLEKLDDYRPDKATRCKMREVLEGLTAEDRKILEDAIADKANWTHHALWAGLKSLGVSVGYSSVHRHRENLCSCGR